MSTRRNICILSAVLAICTLLISSVNAAPSNSNGYYNEVLDETPEEVLMELIARFGQTIMRARDDLENSKRTVDFGLARGFSGIQEAKHRMGLAAANFAGGPGRKRRSEADA